MYTYKNLQDHAYDYLLEAILTEKLLPGQTYSVTLIAEQIGMSRTPVRDALQRLSQEKYVDILPSKGFLVHRISEQDIKEIFELRCAIEGYSCFSLASQITTAQGIEALGKLESCLARQREIAYDFANADIYLEYDRQFHNIITSFSGNSSFINIIDTNNSRITRFAKRSLQQQKFLLKTFEEHNHIYQAISSGDAEASFQAMLDHLKTPMAENLRSLGS
ncbi:MAG: GntR family transcriptional regulator [Clostridiales bacterium]